MGLAPELQGRRVVARLHAADADLVVLTEVRVDLVERHWPHLRDVGPHPGSGQPHGSKVVIASHRPFTVIDNVGRTDLPPRNFLAVDIDDQLVGRVRVIVIVVRYAERARYIDARPGALATCVTPNTLLAGDFNLTMSGHTPLERRLKQVLDAHGLRIVTLGPHHVLAGERPLINHVAVTLDLAAADLMVWPAEQPSAQERHLSDHAGAAVTLAPARRAHI